MGSLIMFYMSKFNMIKVNTKNLSCLKVSRTLLKNDDILLEFRRTWKFLTGAGVLDYILIFSSDDYKLMFQI